MKPYRIYSSLLGLGVILGGLSSCADKFNGDCTVAYDCPEDVVSDGGANAGDGDGDTGGSSGDGDTGGTGGTVGPCDACGGSTPICNASDECVECTSDTHCRDATPVCDTAAEECVGCLENASCTDADASACRAGTCGGCTGDDDCSHIVGKGVCDAGACVECTVEGDNRESDEDACGTGVCNPETLQCDRTRTQNSKDICASCIADNECMVGQNCVPLSYAPESLPEVSQGGFCMKLVPGCSQPYEAGAINRESVSGAPATNYCGLAEEFTTCAAIKDLTDGKVCSSDNDCGSGSGEGRCETVNFSADTKCTYSCTGNAQCESGFDCNGIVGDKYCGG